MNHTDFVHHFGWSGTCILALVLQLLVDSDRDIFHLLKSYQLFSNIIKGELRLDSVKLELSYVLNC
jgi:hypothetical protein